MLLIRKLYQKGLFGILEAVVQRIEALVGRFRRRLEALRLLGQADYSALFVHEGGTRITLPRSSPLLGAFGLDRTLLISADFFRSSFSEAMLRHIIFRLYAGGHIDPGKSIIDIGCWCADNTLAWSRYLHETAVVYAIDPSPENLAYAKALAAENQIANVQWVQAVCSDTAGMPLGFKGRLEHASFHDTAQSDVDQVMSSTLDEIIGPENRAEIAMMHVDVEGFEERVLRGAAGIIEDSRPVIAYEQHLCDDGPDAIFDYLTTKGYRIFMVNEIIAHCRPDCRNFIAFPPEISVPAEMTCVPTGDRPPGHVPAILGPDLLKFTPARNPVQPTREDSEEPGDPQSKH